jgi:hypothetical protein
MHIDIQVHQKIGLWNTCLFGRRWTRMLNPSEYSTPALQADLAILDTRKFWMQIVCAQIQTTSPKIIAPDSQNLVGGLQHQLLQENIFTMWLTTLPTKDWKHGEQALLIRKVGSRPSQVWRQSRGKWKGVLTTLSLLCPNPDNAKIVFVARCATVMKADSSET